MGCVFDKIDLFGQSFVGNKLLFVRPIRSFLNPIAQNLLLGIGQRIIFFLVLDRRHEKFVVHRQSSGPVKRAVLRLSRYDYIVTGKCGGFVIEPYLALGVILAMTTDAVVLQDWLHVPDEIYFA